MPRKRKTTKLMETAAILMPTVLPMWVSGRMTSNTAKVLRPGLMVLSMKVNIQKARSMEEVL